MDHRELRKLFGGTKEQARSAAVERIERRKWKKDAREYRFAGLESKASVGSVRVHFTHTSSAPGGGAYHQRLAVDVGDALDCLSGDLATVPYINLL